MSRSLLAVFALVLASVAACGGKTGDDAKSPASAMSDEPPTPSPNGNQRQLVYEPDDKPPPKQPARPDDALSTPNIVRRVMSDR